MTQDAFSLFEKTEFAQSIKFTPFEPIPDTKPDMNGFQGYHMTGTYRGVEHEAVFNTDTTFGNEHHKVINEKMARAAIITWFQTMRIKIAVAEAEKAFGGKISQIMRHDIIFHPPVDPPNSDVRCYVGEFMGLKLSADVNRNEEHRAISQGLAMPHQNRIEAVLCKRFNEVFHTEVQNKPMAYFE